MQMFPAGSGLSQSQRAGPEDVSWMFVIKDMTFET